MKGRCLIVFLSLSGLFFLLLTRLYHLQLFEEELERRALRQHGLEVKPLPRRGTIFDRKGREFAISLATDSLYAHPKKVASPEEVATILAKILGEEEPLLRGLKSARPFVWLKRKLEKEKAEEIRRLKLKGIGFLEERRRFYPHGEFASHLLGFVGVDDCGLEGIEFLYDRQLQGVGRRYSTRSDGWGREILPFREGHFSSSEGKDLVLTIDGMVQYIAEQELDVVFRESMAKAASIIVSQPKTGEILALANRPTFDPNAFADYPPEARRNRAITDWFEPGSTFKFVTAAASLEEGIFDQEDMVDCEGGEFEVFPGHFIHDYNYRSHPLGELSFSQVIEESSNVGVVKIALRLGEGKLYHYIRRFGFGERTGIDLPGEACGLVRSCSRWSKASIGAIPYGQEVAVTPIQLLMAISAVANGGYLMEPKVVKCIVPDGEEALRFEPKVKRRVISSTTARKLTHILEGVVERGTGRRARISGYSIAGKTGTAQKAEPGVGYSRGKYVVSFVGYFPAYDPEIVILVMIDEPKGNYCGGSLAAPVFRRVAERILGYMRIPPQL